MRARAPSNALTLSIALALGCIVVSPARSQTGDLPDFNSIRTPTSPAFTLLGISPTAVERPNSLSDFAIQLLDRTENLSRLPKDFALEVSPYWLLGKGRNVSWMDDVRRTVSQSAARTFAISVGTAEVGTSAAPATAVALGARTSLCSGRTSAPAMRATRELEGLLAADAARIAESLVAPVQERFRARLARARTDAERERLGEAMTAAIDSATRDASDLTDKDPAGRRHARLRDDAASQRVGFWLEVAGALSWRADSGIVERAVPAQKAAWVTASYNQAAGSLVGVLRFQDSSLADDDGIVDVGARGIITRASWALSSEYVRRVPMKQAGGPDQWRLAGTFDYRLGDDLWINGTFGRDFDDVRAGSLLAQLGVSWHLARKRYAEPSGG